MEILGKPLRSGRMSQRLAAGTVEATVRKTDGGHILGGAVSGRPGKIEVFRAPAPPEFLLNNWQSWGPMQKVTPADSFPELQAIARDYSPYLFSPVPEVALGRLTSDYFVARDGFAAGFLASRFGHPFFTVEGGDIVGWIDYFDARFDSPVPLEPLAILTGGRVEGLLESYGSLAGAANKVQIHPWNPAGWCSWYQYFGNLVWDDVLSNLDVAGKNRAGLPFEVFQVDDGYEREIGDWMSPRTGYPDPAGLAGAIREKGFRAGIWTAPFSAAETSELFREHPGWMVSESGQPKPCYRGWGKQIFALDTTHHEAKNWLFETFSALKRAGFDYFKIDFLFAAAMPGGRAGEATPIQAYREGLEVIRRAVGDAFVLGCGAPLLPSAGLVDGMRIGEDTAPYWKTKPSGFQGPNAYFALKNALMRQFMHGKLWLNDPDCILVRDREIELSPGERELYALAAGALDNMIIDSDNLAFLDDGAKALIRRAIGLRGGRASVSGLMGSLGEDVYLIHSEGGPSGAFLLGVNLSDRPGAAGGRTIPPRSAVFLNPPGR